MRRAGLGLLKNNGRSFSVLLTCKTLIARVAALNTRMDPSRVCNQTSIWLLPVSPIRHSLHNPRCLMPGGGADVVASWALPQLLL
ncbi:hypothetical protein RRG08_053175 [Elysia crispata]|uniref:Uncharacterized protein n=1 Tax=Elysia crispata TaxID=231223 RepID=A0AAE1D2S3_9GAST|nr:hypothetical protein RRG08_053175 [Elysia crispata]